MGSLCFSTVAILRCASFTRLQVFLLIIPTALEIIFSTSLIFINSGTGWRRLWLTAEGCIYFALALVEMLTHILPAVRDSIEVFKVFDRVLAAASFVPILFYTVFILLFASAELVPILPTRLQTITKLLLLLFIPAIVALNELSSFIGVSYRIFRINSRPALAIGFSNDKSHYLWTFFTSLTLALLTAFQAINFSLVFYRTVKAVLDRRRIETTSSDEAHFLKGIGWIAGGLKFGAIETVVGFATNDFGSAMTRRILRLLARGCLCIGLMKGLDSTEDFSHIRDELSGARRGDFRRSRLRLFIANPRLSTFRQLTPTATAFHSAPRATDNIGQRSSLHRVENGLPDMQQFVNLKQNANFRELSNKPPRERVTIHYDKGTPSLHLRFSSLSIPTVPLPVPSPLSERPAIFKKDSGSQSASSQNTPSNKSSLLSALVLDEVEPDVPNVSRTQNYETPRKLLRVGSGRSTKSVPESYTSLTTVHEIVSQFPPLPTQRRSPPKNQPTPGGQFWDDDGASNKSQTTIKPRSPSPDSPGSDVDPFMTGNTPQATDTVFILEERTPTSFRRPPSAPLSSSTTPMTNLSRYMPTPDPSTSAGYTENEYLDFGTALDTGKSRMLVRESTTSNPADWIDYGSIPQSSQTLTPVMEEMEERPRIAATAARAPGRALSSSSPSKPSRGNSSVDGLAVPFSQSPEVEEEEWRLAKAVRRKPQVARIKSFGKAPMRLTPPPVRARHARNSVRIERIVIPPKVDNNVEIVQGSSSMDSTYSRSVLRDAEVIGIEAGSTPQDLRQQNYF